VKRGFDDKLAGDKQKWYKNYWKTEKLCKHSVSEIDVLHLKDEEKEFLDAEIAIFQLKQSRLHDSQMIYV